LAEGEGEKGVERAVAKEEVEWESRRQVGKTWREVTTEYVWQGEKGRRRKR